MTREEAAAALLAIGKRTPKEALQLRIETIDAFRAWWRKPRPSLNEFGIVMESVIVFPEMLYLMITEPEGLE